MKQCSSKCGRLAWYANGLCGVCGAAPEARRLERETRKKALRQERALEARQVLGDKHASRLLARWQDKRHGHGPECPIYVHGSRQYQCQCVVCHCDEPQHGGEFKTCRKCNRPIPRKDP